MIDDQRPSSNINTAVSIEKTVAKQDRDLDRMDWRSATRSLGSRVDGCFG